ncbi:6574_t:CDS:2 [Cetraspora pellucida]|uniref:6574_t:CDS:1 n=1 Tax=Cetraspora pellucida TaxID=1433469 RepID=A0A9N9JAN0_9GLOM|nr:6574_t:CDS:2 [Cetraspora pellucida]
MSHLQPIDQEIGYSLKHIYEVDFIAQYQCILYQNRLKAYNTITKNNSVLPDITLYNAINFVAQVWKNVTAGTIIRSWDRAGILPSITSMSEETRLDMLLFKETELNMSMPEKTELEEEIIDLI